MMSSVNYDFILFKSSGSTFTMVDIYFYAISSHKPAPTQDLTQAWLLHVNYIKVALELLENSIDPVLFRPPYLKLLQFNSEITSKTTWRITSSQVNLVLLSLAQLYLSIV